jgi:tRNA-dihydrouridine synthase B
MKKPLKIGTLEIVPPILAAPMSGLSDRSYRQIAREMGCALAYTEMISAEGLAREHRKTWALVDIDHEEGRVGVQIFGSDAERLAVAASRLEEAGADIIDINMGCPVKKVVKTGAGAALLREPAAIRHIVRAVRAAIRCPLTVKIRSGWERGSRACLEIGRILEAEGADAVCLHPRAYAEGFSGKAHWRLLAELKANSSIPVIGSGDVFSAGDAIRMMRETDCDGVMIARGMVGNPWLLRDAIRQWETGECAGNERARIGWRERVEMILHHASLVIAAKGEERGLRQFRKQLLAYLHGVPGVRRLKPELMRVSRFEELRRILEDPVCELGRQGECAD